ncbi:MAG: TM2 domain-containing protein, partial [Flavobacteriales bacterium]|nr:TM2 domain-containing protein [Flavobacteriales bacterium]
KVIAAILALPPLGWFGLHRAYLGCRPVIPVLYFVTFGGALGIIPFIDLMVIILSKDTKPFYQNSKILMWYKKEKKKKKKS